MDDLCATMTNLNIVTRYLLNIETWQTKKRDSQNNQYMEIITNNEIYLCYENGDIYVISNSNYVKIKKIDLIHQGEDDIIVVPHFS